MKIRILTIGKLKEKYLDWWSSFKRGLFNIDKIILKELRGILKDLKGKYWGKAGKNTGI